MPGESTQLLNRQGFTVRGAQRVLEGKAEAEAPQPSSVEPTTPATVEIAPPLPATVTAQPELALGEARPSKPVSGQIDSSDIALLIARLTVIRENLKEAIDAA